MKKTIQSGIIGAATALFCVLGSATRADASFIAYICDDMLCAGGNDTIITDNGPGDNFPGSALTGQINSGALSFNGFTIITNVSQSKPLIGSATSPQIDLTFSAVTNDNLSHTIFLYATDTGFTGTGPLALTLGGTQASTPPGSLNTIRGRAWGGTSNTELDISAVNLLADTGTVSTTPFALTDGGVLSSPVLPFYSLTAGLTITRATAGTTTGDLNVSVNAVPEPASMALVAIGLAALAAVRRRSGRT